jgi:4-amino-4-deoxy-L-arabinose transferase-like glycosyltransferase
MKTNGRTRGSIWLIVAAGFLIRAGGALDASLTYDESLTLAFAERLPSGERPSDHPPIALWLIKSVEVVAAMASPPADSRWFALARRGPSVFLGTATLFVVYLAGRRLGGDRAGRFSAALLAGSQFHASWSRLLVEESALLFGLACAALAAIRAVDGPEKESLRWSVWAGVAIGGASLAKETALIVLPALGAGLLASPRGRWALRTPGPWLGAAIAAIPFSVFLTQDARHFPAGVAGRMSLLADHPQGFSPLASSLYLGELYRMIGDQDLLDPAYETAGAFAMSWPAGLFLLAACGRALRGDRCHSPSTRLMGVGSLGILVILTLTGPPGAFDPFWWSSPAVVFMIPLGGSLLDRLAGGGRGASVVVSTVLIVQMFLTLERIRAPILGEPRRDRTAWAALLARDGSALAAEGDWRTAWTQAQLSLTLDPGGPGRDLLTRLASTPAAIASAPRFSFLAARALSLSSKDYPREAK